MIRPTIVSVVTAFCVLAAAAVGHAQAQEVVLSAAGGSVQQAYQTKILPVFERETGIKVRYVASTVLESVAKVEAQRSRPEIDVVILTDDAYAAYRRKGLFEKLTPDMVPRIADIYPSLAYPEDYGAPIFVLNTGIVYNKEIFEEHGFPRPESIYDLWKPEYRGRVVLWTPRTSTGMLFLLAVARAEGGDATNMDPAFKKIEEIAPYVDFNRADEMTTLLQQEQAWLGWWNSIRVSQLQAQNFPVELVGPKEGTPAFTNGVVLTQGAPNRENGLKLINWLLSDEGQTLIAEHQGAGPTVQTVTLPPELASKVPYGEGMKGIFVADMDAVVTHRADWIERWAKEIE